jgi:plastocyanin
MSRIVSRRFSLSAGVVAVGLAVISLVASPSSAGAARQLDARIADEAFSPANLVIQVGDTVTWSNDDDRPHTVTADDGSFDSGNIDEGAAFSFTFTQAGTFSYHCDYHPDMQASITVEEAAGVPAAEGPADDGGNANQPAGEGHSGGADHAGAAHREASASSGDQPDTALPTPAAIPGLSWVLWGLGFIALAITVLPARKSASVSDQLPTGGWRR